MSEREFQSIAKEDVGEVTLTTRKSILDGIPVEDKALKYSLRGPENQGALRTAKLLSVVGNCPQCGGAVYGDSCVPEDAEPTPAKYSCKCFRKDGIVKQQMEHLGK